jgi:hypothetical protein
MFSGGKAFAHNGSMEDRPFRNLLSGGGKFVETEHEIGNAGVPLRLSGLQKAVEKLFGQLGRHQDQHRASLT